MKKILPFLALSISGYSSEWIVKEYASVSDQIGNRIKNEYVISPIIAHDGTKTAVNLTPGKDDDIIDTLAPGTALDLKSFRRGIAEVIQTMPCQDSLKIMTRVVPFQSLDRHLGSTPQDARRISFLKIEACGDPTPLVCKKTADPKYGSFEYADFRSALVDCADMLNGQFNDRNAAKGSATSANKKH